MCRLFCQPIHSEDAGKVFCSHLTSGFHQESVQTDSTFSSGKHSTDLMLTEYASVLLQDCNPFSMTTEKASAEETTSAMEGDAVRTSQVGALGNSQQP